MARLREMFLVFAVFGLTRPAIAQETPAPAEEVRESYNSAGLLVRRLTLVGGQLVEELANAYDASGHLTQSTTSRDGHTTVETQRWGEDGALASREITQDGAPESAETYSWDGSKMLSRTVTTGGRTETTTFSYDASGAPTLVETRAEDGALVSRVISDREPAPEPVVPVPITLSVNGGVSTDSDVQTTSISGGFALSRKPDETQDPLEVSAYGGYTRGVSKGERTNDDLTAGFGLDYNHFVERTTAFLFMAFERNPVANLDIDLELAPIGLKYDLVPEGGLFWMDASFAPVWSYRSILVAAGETCDEATVAVDTHCTFSDLRGSFRVRLGLSAGGFALKDTVEFLPTLTPNADLVTALSDESILRNTAGLTVKLTGRLSLSEKLVFTRDKRLIAQVDCAAEPDSLLCDGLSLQSSSSLSLDLSF